MQLTKAIRDDFLDEVMEAIPRKNHYRREDALEEIRKAVEEQLPREIIDFSKAYPQLTRRDNCIEIEALTFDYECDRGFLRKSTPAIRTFKHELAKLVDVTPWAKLKEAYDAEEYERKQYRSRLGEIVGACRTLKQLEEALPELKSYMPAEPEKRNLPVAAGTIVTDLLKAGLKVPKGELATA